MVNKAQLIEHMAEQTGLSKSVAKVAFESLFSHITDSLAKGEKVSISSFGLFEVKERAARRGVSPRQPDKAIMIPSVKVARFRAGKGLKMSVR